jgi:hypothetical protein
MSLILTKAKKQGFLPDVSDAEVDILSTEAKTLFGLDGNFAPIRKLANATDLNGVSFAGTNLSIVGVTSTGVFLKQGTILRWSPNKGTSIYNATYPTSTSNAQYLYEWKGYVYGVFNDDTDSLQKVYRAISPTITVPAMVWSGPLMTLTTGANASAPSITATDTALVICEQGDPVVATVKSAKLWRTLDGTTFTAVKTLPSNYRHFHCVAADPFNPGHIWATSGDNVDNCFHKSTDHGATWTDITTSMTFQSVQISFTKDLIYLAPDALGQAAVYIMDRFTNKIEVGSFASYRQLRIVEEGVYYFGNTDSTATFTTGDPVFSTADIGRKITGPGIPNGATITGFNSNVSVTLSAPATATATNIKFAIQRQERPYQVAFTGLVDPNTGIYYGVANAEIGGWTANSGTYARPVLFMVPYPGGPVVGLGELSTRISPALFFAQGDVWFGANYRPLISLNS